ncbi:MAG: hypothetical protein ACLTTU_08375 [Bilophila wadsworthia]
MELLNVTPPRCGWSSRRCPGSGYPAGGPRNWTACFDLAKEAHSLDAHSCGCHKFSALHPIRGAGIRLVCRIHRHGFAGELIMV